MADRMTPVEARLQILGRSMLEAAGLTDVVIRKAHQRLAEGLDADTVKVFHSEGEILYSQPLTDWTERREAAKEVLKLADHYPARTEHEFAGEITFVVKGLDLDTV